MGRGKRKGEGAREGGIVGFVRNWKLTKNKSLEVQISRFEPHYRLTIDFRWKGKDHAGPYIGIEFWKLYAHIELYDRRHWDRKNNCWVSTVA